MIEKLNYQLNEDYCLGNFWIALLFTTLAGLSTGIGSAITLFAKKTNTKLLSFCLGFSAGVMIYVSLVEILVEGKDSLALDLGVKRGTLFATIAFFGGMLLIALIDKIIPEKNNPHELKGKDGGDTKTKSKNELRRAGVMMAIAIAIHNFPEGIASFFSAFQSSSIAIPVILAIAIHNIPEGISVSMPIYYATGNKKKSFLLSSISGLAEPVGGLVGYFILRPFLNNTLMGILLAAVAGIMVFISFDELLPLSEEYGEHHLSIYGLVSGMGIMAISLLLFM